MSRKCQTHPRSGSFPPPQRTAEQIRSAQEHLIEQRASIKLRSKKFVPEPALPNQLSAPQLSQEQIISAQKYLVEQRASICLRARFEVPEPKEYEWPLRNQLSAAQLEESQRRNAGWRPDPDEKLQETETELDRGYGQFRREMGDLIPQSVLERGRGARGLRVGARISREADVNVSTVFHAQSEQTATSSVRRTRVRGGVGEGYATVRSKTVLREEVSVEDVVDREGLGRVRDFVMLPRQFPLAPNVPVGVSRWKWS